MSLFLTAVLLFLPQQSAMDGHLLRLTQKGSYYCTPEVMESSTEFGVIRDNFDARCGYASVNDLRSEAVQVLQCLCNIDEHVKDVVVRIRFLSTRPVLCIQQEPFQCQPLNTHSPNSQY